jgi:hypothetical protein
MGSNAMSIISPSSPRIRVGYEMRGGLTRSLLTSNLTLFPPYPTPNKTSPTALTSSITTPNRPTSTDTGSSPINPNKTECGVICPNPVAARDPWRETFRVCICGIRVVGREVMKIFAALLVSPELFTGVRYRRWRTSSGPPYGTSLDLSLLKTSQRWI